MGICKISELRAIAMGSAAGWRASHAVGKCVHIYGQVKAELVVVNLPNHGVYVNLLGCPVVHSFVHLAHELGGSPLQVRTNGVLVIASKTHENLLGVSQ